MQSQRIQTEVISIKDIHPYENNPRKNDKAVKSVMESIQQCGYISPIIVDEDNVILAGHTRFKAMKRLGYQEIEVVKRVGLTEEQKKKYRILDNKTNELAEWDYELLAKEIEGLNFGELEVDWGLPEEEKEVQEDYFDVDEELEKVKYPTAKLGDIYQLGNHRIMCGDSTNESDVRKLIDGYEMDLCVTDPPYNVNYGSKADDINKYGYHFTDRRIENDYMPKEQFIEFLGKAFANMKTALRNGGAFYIWHASITQLEFEMALRINNLQARQQLIWVKNTIIIGMQDYQWMHEPCLYGWKEGQAHYFVDDRTKRTIVLDEPMKDIEKMKKEELVKILNDIKAQNNPESIIRIDKPSISAEHPTMKPLKLLEHLIRNSSQKGERVIDLFGGSGSTLMTCEQMDRICYIMEYDPKYVDVIIERWEKYTGDKAIKLN